MKNLLIYFDVGRKYLVVYQVESDLAEGVFHNRKRDTVIDELDETMLGHAFDKLCAKLRALLCSAVGHACSIEDRDVFCHC